MTSRNHAAGNQPPGIARAAWGRIELTDGRSFKDVKLYPGGARAWDWRETGTRHSPGVQPADVQELAAAGATRIVLGTGYHQQLGVCDATRRELADQQVAVEALETGAAVDRYTALRDREAVAALLHSTC